MILVRREENRKTTKRWGVTLWYTTLIPNQGMPIHSSVAQRGRIFDPALSVFASRIPKTQWNWSFTSTARFRCAGCFPYIDPKHRLAGIAKSMGGTLSQGPHHSKIFFPYKCSYCYWLSWLHCKACEKLCCYLKTQDLESCYVKRILPLVKIVYFSGKKWKSQFLEPWIREDRTREKKKSQTYPATLHPVFWFFYFFF